MPCFLFSAVSSPWRRMDVQQSHETLSQTQRRTSILCIDRIINTLCVQTLMTSNLIRAFNQKFQQCFFIATSCFSNALSRTGNQGIAILSCVGLTPHCRPTTESHFVRRNHGQDCDDMVLSAILEPDSWHPLFLPRLFVLSGEQYSRKEERKLT